MRFVFEDSAGYLNNFEQRHKIGSELRFAIFDLDSVIHTGSHHGHIHF